MKKLIRSAVLVAGLLLYTQFSYSQISLGPRAGLNISKVVGTSTNTHFKPGLHLGAFARLKLNDKFTFQPEALFSMKGYTYKNSLGQGAQLLNYIDVPLAIMYGKIQGLNVLIGTQPSLLTGAKNKHKSNPDPKVITENKDSFNKV